MKKVFLVMAFALALAACASQDGTPARPTAITQKKTAQPTTTPAPTTIASATATPATITTHPYQWNLPQGVPLPIIPAENPMTQEGVELGRYLFYDLRLSGNGQQSCASCHIQGLGFSDGRKTGIGSTGEAHARNVPALANVAWYASLTWANPVLEKLEQQIQLPMFGEFPVELGITGHDDEVLGRIRAEPRYAKLFATAYPGQHDPINFGNIVRALASFVRALDSYNSAYDRYTRGDASAMSDSAVRGAQLFFGEELECHHCHTGFNFSLATTQQGATFSEKVFFNTGLYNIDGKGGLPVNSRGLVDLTNDPNDMGKFRPPTLRNVAVTAPYMHDGSFATLDEVIAFYARGGRLIASGENKGDGKKSPFKNGLVSGFKITKQQQADLVAFLKSLTDESFLNDPRLGNPWIE